MAIKYRKNEKWEFEVIQVRADNVNGGITSWFKSDYKYGDNIDIIETEVISTGDSEGELTLQILVKFAIL